MSEPAHLRFAHRLLLLASTVVASALTACSPGSSGQPANTFNPLAAPTPILSPLRELVEMQRAGEEDWEIVRGAIAVADGDAIRTSVGGVALLVFSDGTSTEVHPNTILEIDRYEARRSSLAVELTLLSGQVLNRVDPLADDDSRHWLVTPPGTAEVTGTAYWTWVEDDGLTKFLVTEGVLVVRLGDGRSPLTMEAGACLELDTVGDIVNDCSDEEPPNPLTEGQPSLRVSTLSGPVDLSNCGDGTCDESVGENRFSCRLDCNKPTCGNGICEPEETSATCDNDCVGLGGAICGDGVCQPGSGEDFITCQADCEPPPLFCGDGLCSDSAGEDLISCAADCAPLGFCGDGLCNPATDENEISCRVDCGAPAICGDGLCEPLFGESRSTCSQDCGLFMNCGNSVCDEGTDENALTCPSDCAPPTPDPCGDGFCDLDGGEDETTCPLDCAIQPPDPCGDGFCDAAIGEDETSCPLDCTVEPPDPCGDGVCDAASGEDETTCPLDCTAEPPDPCGDGVCDASSGEDETTCPLDCTVEPPDPCGDGICDAASGEDETTCPADCTVEPPNPCGDGVCDAATGEDETTCPADCTVDPPDPCGDGVCDAASGEDETTCPADCPAQTSANPNPFTLACLPPTPRLICRLSA